MMNPFLRYSYHPHPSWHSLLAVALLLVAAGLALWFFLSVDQSDVQPTHDTSDTQPPVSADPDTVIATYEDFVLTQGDLDLYLQLLEEHKVSFQDMQFTGLYPDHENPTVLTALESINVDPPAGDGNELDRYIEAQEAYAEYDNDVTIPFFFYGRSPFDITHASPFTAEIYQMRDELRALATYFDAEFERAPLYERYPDDVEQIADHWDNILHEERDFTVYPNLRVVDGFFWAEFFGQIRPEAADIYMGHAETFAEIGMSYGLYGPSDIDASRSLVQQYMQQWLEQPSNQALLDAMREPIMTLITTP